MTKTLTIAVVLAVATSVADAQVMINQQYPLQTNRDSFFEYTGMNWNLRGPGFTASFGQPFQGAPAFGNFNPQAGLQTGFAFGNGPFSGSLGFNFAQGYSRSSVSVTPVINSLNGYPASLQAGVLRPFVLGLQPVVASGFGGGFNNGGFFNVPQYASPQHVPYRLVPEETPLTGLMRRIQERGGSTNPGQVAQAETPRPDENRESVASRYFQAGGGTQAASADPSAPSAPETADDADRVAMDLFRKGMDAEANSKTGSARMYYRIASEKASGPLKQRILLKLSELR